MPYMILFRKKSS